MKLQFLGTGAGVPGRIRNVSALVLKLLDEINEIWLFDCGEATQHQILKTTIKPRKITNVFITHMHGDHIYGLPGFLSSRSFQGGEGPLTIYGPPGIRQFVQMTLKLSKTKLLYKLKIVELDPNGGSINLDKGWKVDYLPLEHGVLSFGYRITEPDSVGELLVDRLAEYKIPNGPIFGQIKRGEQVTLADGTVLNGKDFVAPDHKGKVVTILGDTRQCNNIHQLAQGANVLVHEATHDSSEEKMAHAYFHSTNQQAAKVALKAGVEQLYLNHISARYLGQDVKELEKGAQSIFKQSKVVFDLEEYDLNSLN
ncbi:ribonuclease Z [Fundicoccus ignavus]|uniref:Ribonuclease Z n=1 Tax=Fundicoccus ignavus TaxID=2664442 RepID=A0A6I2GE41_9LACT|nr:ribonuclease Z [Fundicoccus ignavus]MRI84904.1 ribonuclease Z [Fundicoccus ignavus]MRJ46453.1 ribonuclease Z [Fundicoccus ignavus]